MSADAPLRVFGIVLAGGRSLRMGHDKAGLAIGGRTLLDHVIERLRPQCRAIVISRHDGRLAGHGTDCPVVADATPDHAGPLAGILAGLDWVAATDPAATQAVTVPVDVPFLPLDLVSRLVDGCQSHQSAAACAASGGRIHPVTALWPVSARTALRHDLVGEGSRRVGRFLDRFAPAVVEWPIWPFDPFLNINAPDDLARAEALTVETIGPSRVASARM